MVWGKHCGRFDGILGGKWLSVRFGNLQRHVDVFAPDVSSLLVLKDCVQYDPREICHFWLWLWFVESLATSSEYDQGSS